ncbi:Putative thioesterase, Acyl transferase domain superfamily, phosphopantetheine binding ACP [Colletotrichum destructivum]|uniref:Thioesterase, Acyl transferase domain superfamily, phosphopantetheine binding ACP n=1 Tax=Colletotrichum destructivum TaxID=34406 RepID=A0AAX4IIR4_9PEZI|nr:Putative thioesterase, Acyl transferase domain superfamily, phosphopantetheine binding ACP [Colletotrichum destructivum]
MPTQQPEMLAYVFGDQTHDLTDDLLGLLQSRDDPLVVNFLERSCAVLKSETARLPPDHQARCPRFSSIADLLAPYSERTLNPCLVQALTCITQLGLFIRQHSSRCEAYPSPERTCLAGVCTGAIAAAAVSFAHSAPSLLSPALHAVTVAVRVGALAWDVADRISHHHHGDDESTPTETAAAAFESWSRVVAGCPLSSLTDTLVRYASDKGLSAIKTPYISAVLGPTQATVSGPPEVLSDFFTSGACREIAPSSASLRITAPYHSAVLFHEEDIEQILEGVPKSGRQQPDVDGIPIVSISAEGQQQQDQQQEEEEEQGLYKAVSSQSLHDALGQAVRECLVRAVALDKLPARIAEHAKTVVAPAGAQHPARVSLRFFGVQNRESLVAQMRLLLPSDAYCVTQAMTGQTLEDFPASPSPSVSASTPNGTRNVPEAAAAAAEGSNAKQPLAILSASGRFPGNADTMDQFWDILYNGIDTHEMVPPSRWDASTHVGDTSIKNVSGTGYGCWLHQAGQFDTTFFNISPREASRIDPAQRLALMTAAEALEKAGIVPDRTPSTMRHRVGVWYGSCSMDWLETNSAQDIDAYFIPGGARAFIAGRVNYFFKFTGPSFTVDTACSSSLAALHLACNALWRGEVDTAVVGGTNMTTNPDITAGLDRGHFLSRTGNCKTFDDAADGYCRGEAAVTLVLKRLSDARRDNDPIEACLLSVATNHNAEAESITRPNTAAQRELFRGLLADAVVRPNDISYVEMHGTGTQAGDAGETSSIVNTLSPLTARGSCLRPASSPLYLGAAKANVGHSEAASGVTSIAKVLMMMKHSIIPPHIGVKTEFNRRLPNLAQRNARIAMVPTAWPRPPHGGSRRVLLNNFSAAGGNTSIVMEDAPPPCVTGGEAGIDPRRRHVVTISAKTPESLVSNVANLAHWLEDDAEVSSQQQQEDATNQNLLAQLSYTTTARRTHHRYRVAVVAGSASKLASSLRKQLETLNGGDKILPAPSKAPGVVFTFTGQGSQYAGMGEALYARFASFRTDLRRCDHLCIRMGYPSIVALFETASSRDAFDRASLTCLQLAHVSFQMALCKLWESFGITPTAVVGHSLGEYAALYAAGVLSQSDVLYLVGRRSQIMEEQLPEGTHAMLAVKAGEASIMQHLDVGVGVGEVLEVACRNGPANTVLGGAISDIQEAQSALEAKGIRCRVLETAHAFHTAQVEPVLAYFRKATKGVVMRRPRIPVLSPVLGKVLRKSADFGDDYFVKHCRQPVNLVQAVSAAAVEGIVGNRTFAIEIGPAPLVAPMVRDIIGNRTTMQTCASVNKTMDPWQLLAEALSRLYLAGVSVDWNKYHQDFPECHRVLPIPVYGWTLKEYWMQYTNDWSLRKGDPAWVAPREVPLAFSSIYKVVKNTLQASAGGEAVVDIDLQDDEDVRAMARGHKVYGVSLVTPSMYADVAQMIGKYVLRDTGTGPGGEAVVPEVAEMRIQSALVANDVNAKQVLRTTAKFNEAKTSLSCSFSSVDSNGKIVEQHANCVIRFVDVDAVRARSQEAADHAAACMKDMQSCFGVDDNIFRLSRSMLYKMVGKIADFDPRYRGLSSFTINNGTLEALGTASFQGMPDASKWFANPGFLDAVSQLAGFAMNANESIDIEREVYVNHGWESMTLFAPRLDVDATYRLYVRMVPAENDLWRGDVFVFDEEEEGGALAGILRGCALQRVSKRVMEFIVNSASKKSSSTPSSRGLTAAHERSQSQSRWDTGLPRRSASECRTPAPVPVKGPAAAQDAWPRALKIVAEESGMEEDELADGVALGDIGVDSLLSLVITGRFHDELDIDLPGRSLFEECLTIGDIRTCLFGGAGAPLVEDAAEPIAFTSTASVTASSTACSDDTDSATTISSSSRTHTYGNMEDSHYHSGLEIGDGGINHEKKMLQSPPPTAISPGKAPPAWSMYVQGARGRSKENLFFFPDGCGTATSYLCLPSISPDMALIAFNSPFAKNPERMYEYSLQDVLQSYLDGIRSRQPHGPYRLGGWSAGGILAYAAAQKLIAAGEDVISLTIIDSPAPVRGLEILPESFYDHCLRTGIFRSEMRRDTVARTDGGGGGGGPGGAVSGSSQKWADPPEWLVAHFRAATALLSDYYAQPLPAEAARRMRVTIVWAGQTAFDGVRYASLSEALRADAEAGEREGVRFLTESRTDFGPGDWAKLLPGAAISTHAVEGEHHFSIMRGKGAEKVVEFVRGGL